MDDSPEVESWNYRVTSQTYLNTGETLFSIREVYYDAYGNPMLWSERPSELDGYDDIQSLRIELSAMLEALDKPVLDLDRQYRL